MTTEHRIQNDIRNALAGACILWRANVGTGWQGVGKPFKATKPMVVSLQPGDMVLRQARPFSTGLPEGFTDTFGMVHVTITQDMVGKQFPLPLFGEIKREDGRRSAPQSRFGSAMQAHGAVYGLWRSVADAEATIRNARGYL